MILRKVMQSRALRAVRSQADLGNEKNRPLAIRLGLRMVRGLAEADAARLVAMRPAGGFASYEDFARRTGFSNAVLSRLSKANAFGSLDVNRREAAWLSLPARVQLPLFDDLDEADSVVNLPQPSDFEEVAADYTSTGLSLQNHPLSFLRERLKERWRDGGSRSAKWPHDQQVTVAGLVLLRQRPSTAKGITFVTLEDETGHGEPHHLCRRVGTLPPGSSGSGGPAGDGYAPASTPSDTCAGRAVAGSFGCGCRR